MTEKERILAGKLYSAQDKELRHELFKAKKLTRLFNNSIEYDTEYRNNLIKNLFKSIKDNFYIEPPFRCDYGCNITIGKNFFANYDCIILDVCEVNIGDNVLFGPRVNIFTASHPIDANVRNTNLECGKPINIGNNVWIGGNTVINPGVKIGNNVVIGSGSVVTKDIPDNVIAIGNPCKILREINDDDKKYWEKQKEEYYTYANKVK